MPPIVSAAGHIRSSAVRGERDIEAGAAVGAEAVAIRRLTLAGLAEPALPRAPRRVQPAAMGILDVADRVWPVTRNLMKGHTAVYRATGGVVGDWIPGGPSILLLHHLGPQGGTKPSSSLVYLQRFPQP